jgi:hypothetical protein
MTHRLTVLNQMQRLKVFGLAMAVACTACAIASASASAAELPEFKVETAFTGTSSTMIFETAKGSESKITCKKTEMEGTALSKESGMLHLVLKECSTLLGLAKCTTAGQATGTVVISGEWQFALKGTKEAFLMLSTTGSHFECASTSEELKGTFLDQMTPMSTETTKYESKGKESKGTPEFTEFGNDLGEKAKAQLLLTSGGKEPEVVGQEATESKITTVKTTLIQIGAGPTVTVTPVTVDVGKLKPMESKTETFTYTVSAGSVPWRSTSRVVTPDYNSGTFKYLIPNEECLGKRLTAGQSCKIVLGLEALMAGEPLARVHYRLTPGPATAITVEAES